jgi:hypothetical protein
VSTESKLKAVRSHSVFGPPPLLEGEDAAAYDEFYGRVCAALKPADVIEEMLVADLVGLEWELLRWRRFKSSLIQARGLKALERFLEKQLDYHFYREHFEDDLAEILQDNLKGDQAQDVARTLAHDCAWNKPDAVDKVDAILDRIGTYMRKVLDDAKARKAKQLVQEYVRREPAAVELIHKLLAGAGLSIDGLIVQDLPESELDRIERIDRLATLAETRRNACLREIDRRRDLGQKVRKSLQELEDNQFEVIEAAPALQPRDKDSN